jgi:hypothetical protein
MDCRDNVCKNIRMFHYIARIKYSKYRELQKGHMHPDNVNVDNENIDNENVENENVQN